jgi:hypothetical protein
MQRIFFVGHAPDFGAARAASVVVIEATGGDCSAREPSDEVDMIGEWKRNIGRGKQVHGAAAVACLGLALALVGCSDDDGDDLTFEDASADGAARADSASKDAAKDIAVSDVSADRATADQAAPDAGRVDAARDAPATDAARDAPVTDVGTSPSDARPNDARADAPADATPRDATNDGDASRPDASADATTVDAAREAAAEAEAAAPVPLRMCGVLDSAWGIATDASACATATTDSCPDRGGNWIFDIAYGFLSGPVFHDCRINATLPNEDATAAAYYERVAGWTPQFFGCPNPANNAPPFGLIPADQSARVYTTADLQLLSDYYVQAIVDAFENPGNGAGPLTPLTPTQLGQVRAELARLAALVPGTVTSNNYSSNACPADAGSDGRTD